MVWDMIDNGNNTYNVHLYGARQPDPGSLDPYTNTNCINWSNRHVNPISSGGGISFWRPPNY
jgi:hypothetical protein